MPTNDFLPWAIATGANVATQSDFASSTPLGPGFASGAVLSKYYNKVMRQSSVMSATIGNFMNAQGVNALDDGNMSNALANFSAAFNAFVAAMIAVETSNRQAADTTISNHLQYLVQNSPDGDTWNLSSQNQTFDAVIYWARYYGRKYGSANFTYIAGNTTIDPNALGAIPVNAGSGSLTITLPAAAAFPNGGTAVPHFSLYRCDGQSSNTVAIHCAGSDVFGLTVADSLTSTDLLPGEYLSFVSDGVSKWYCRRICKGRKVRYRGIVGNGSTTPATATWTPPVGVYSVRIRINGGGGGGGSGNSSGGGGGGGGAGGSEIDLPCFPGVPISVTLGNGGPDGSGTAGTGVSGGTTTISGTSCTATGGTGGQFGGLNPANGGGQPGQGYGGNVNLTGGYGNDGSFDATAGSGMGGGAPFGGFGGKATNATGSINGCPGTDGGGGGGTYGSGSTNPPGNGGPGFAEFDPQ